MAMTEAEQKEFNEAKAELVAFKAEKEKAEKEKAEKEKTEKEKTGVENETLIATQKKQAEAKEQRDAERKSLESAVTFNVSLPEFAKTNSVLLPGEFSDILKAAESKVYDSAQDKANAVKTALAQTFFAIQANLDLLTPSQKATIQHFLSLSEKAKEEKAVSIYENVFEPALETLRKIKKAEEVGKGRRHGEKAATKDAYRDKLIAHSRKSLLGDKEST